MFAVCGVALALIGTATAATPKAIATLQIVGAMALLWGVAIDVWARFTAHAKARRLAAEAQAREERRRLLQAERQARREASARERARMMATATQHLRAAGTATGETLAQATTAAAEAASALAAVTREVADRAGAGTGAALKTAGTQAGALASSALDTVDKLGRRLRRKAIADPAAD